MEPITIGIAFAAAKAAVAGVKEAIALGHEIQDCYHDIASFFNAQGEIEAAVVQQKEDRKIGKAPAKSATSEALDAMFASRQMKRMEQELKEMLIYNSGESGLYDEMCQRRDEIVFARKQEIEDAARQERLRLAAIARKKQERIDAIQNWLTAIVGATISGAIIYFIWWMFHWKDH